jgi:hypothetical protein
MLVFASLAPPASMLDLEFAELSDAGRVRGHNEDHAGCFAWLREARRIRF